MLTGRSLKGKAGLVGVLVVGVLALAAAVALAESGPPPPGGGQPPPGGQMPPGGQPPGGEQPGGDQGGPCIPLPAGVDPAVLGPIFEGMRTKFENLGHPPSDEDVDKIVEAAAAAAGVTDPVAIQFVKDDVHAHMAGGKCEGSGSAPGADKDGVPEGGFHQGFLNRTLRSEVEVDSVDGNVVAGTLAKIIKLPKKFKDDAAEMLDQDVLVLAGSARIRDKDGNKADLKDVAGADKILVKGKVLPSDKWQKDEDGQLTPTIRGKRITIL